MPSSITSHARSTASTGPGGGVVKRKVDDRLKTLLEYLPNRKHRGLILLVGDRAKEQIVNLHLIVSRANHNAKVNVLWCMKKELDFGSTSQKKLERRGRLEVKGGMATEASKEAFETFLTQTQIRFCKYSETHKILGQTFGMAVLQDFEAITPNTLARTVETVKGGGVVVIMFRAMQSLRQLYTIVMDVHARYKTESQRDVVPRFNERFLLSLVDCDTALCLDDDLNVLPITQRMRGGGGSGLGATPRDDPALVLQGRLRHEAELAQLKERIAPSAVVGPLVQRCQTMDQAKTVLSLMQAITEKSLDATCVVTAGRGRGKSAALGMAAAGAIAQGYSNIFCTAPSPENLQTFFEFAIRGLKDFGYVESTHFEVLQSNSEDFARCIIRIHVFKEHRQTIQFVSATDAEAFAQAELAIIDEAAALPLPLVKRMLGPYLIFLSSTVSGYEGTGRSLSMKLIADMRKRRGGGGQGANGAPTGGRQLKEMSMHDAIRYGPGDPLEKWLNTLLCLDATEKAVPLRSSPHPKTCELYYVNRDALFSYHPFAEEVLQRIQALLVAAHYKNQPNDLQLLSDAPGHHLFVLCSASLEDEGQSLDTRAGGDEGRKGLMEKVPDIYCVVHVCEEGQVSAETVRSNLSHGLRPSGDLIPYTLSQYYLEEGFAKLAGMRVVRIATSPELQRAGYGSRSLALLQAYYSGSISLTAAAKPGETAQTSAATRLSSDGEGVEQEARLQSRGRVLNLFTPLVERPYEVLDYLGVSFGLTTELFNFWKRAGYEALYVRQAANDLTGEHSCVMIRPNGLDLTPLKEEFRRRFLRLLSMPFRSLSTELCLSVLSDLDVHDAKKLFELTDATQAAELRIVRVGGVRQANRTDLTEIFSASDLKRLQLFSTSYVEGSNVLDLIPAVAKLYFEHRLYKAPDGTEGVILTHAQAAVLLAVGLQCQSLEELSKQEAFASVHILQLRAFLQKGLSRLIEHFGALQRLDKTHTKRDREDGVDIAKEDEEVREIKDASGKVVGLTVAKKVKKHIEVDSTLLRDSSVIAVAGGSSQEKASSSLQEVFHRPKKKSSRHR
ncbi:unnamed protein product [Phytomonas sp. EM1]|nr:unnamed protein product [Phytomonas sp. EM1]|eukprot:CCW65696.1 unnamed protein product [Phytomonas sp. isolate EM1]